MLCSGDELGLDDRCRRHPHPARRHARSVAPLDGPRRRRGARRRRQAQPRRRAVDHRPRARGGGGHRRAAALAGHRRSPESATRPPTTSRSTSRTPACARRFVGRYVDGVTVGPSPLDVQRRLLAAGVRPISNVVDASNYVMLELGKPIHTFDAAAVADGAIVVRPARPGERLETLDHVERDARPGHAAHRRRARAAGHRRRHGRRRRARSPRRPRAVVVESAIFDPVSIRRTAFRYALRSEASLRFEKGQEHRLARMRRRPDGAADPRLGRRRVPRSGSSTPTPSTGRRPGAVPAGPRLAAAGRGHRGRRAGALLARVEVATEPATAGDAMPVADGGRTVARRPSTRGARGDRAGASPRPRHRGGHRRGGRPRPRLRDAPAGACPRHGMPGLPARPAAARRPAAGPARRAGPDRGRDPRPHRPRGPRTPGHRRRRPSHHPGRQPGHRRPLRAAPLAAAGAAPRCSATTSASAAHDVAIFEIGGVQHLTMACPPRPWCWASCWPATGSRAPGTSPRTRAEIADVHRACGAALAERLHAGRLPRVGTQGALAGRRASRSYVAAQIACVWRYGPDIGRCRRARTRASSRMPSVPAPRARGLRHARPRGPLLGRHPGHAADGALAACHPPSSGISPWSSMPALPVGDVVEGAYLRRGLARCCVTCALFDRYRGAPPVGERMQPRLSATVPRRADVDGRGHRGARRGRRRRPARPLWSAAPRLTCLPGWVPRCAGRLPRPMRRCYPSRGCQPARSRRWTSSRSSTA